MNEPTILDIQQVSFRYKDEEVLTNITLPVYERDLLALIGPNGAGKTTLVKLILGLLTPNQGSIHFAPKMGDLKRLSIGYVPQYLNLDRSFPIKVLDMVLMGLIGPDRYFKWYSKKDTLKALEALGYVTMESYAHRYLNELSGGQFQRVLIARSLVSNPAMLILDEPTNFIDKESKKSLSLLLEEWNKKITIIIVTHDISFLYDSVKHIACINRSLFYHGTELTQDQIEKTYHCPVDIVTHGAPHRVFRSH